MNCRTLWSGSIITFLFAGITFAQEPIAPPEPSVPSIPVPELEIPNRLIDDTLLNDLVPRKARLGVVVEALSPQLSSHLGVSKGIYVERVDTDGPAFIAGLRSGDVIVAVNDTPVNRISDLMAAVAESDGAAIEVTLDGKQGRRSIEVKPVMVDQPQRRGNDIEEIAPPQLNNRRPQSITRDIVQQLMNEFGSNLDGRTLDDLGGLANQLLGAGESQKQDLPKHIKIEIQRIDDRHADVNVEIDGETFETDAQHLNVLPPAVRRQIEGLVHGRRGTHIDLGGLQIDLNRRGLPNQRSGTPPTQSIPTPDQPIILDEIEQLRREMDLLKQQLNNKQPTDLSEFD